jgi:hypothetical protein
VTRSRGAQKKAVGVTAIERCLHDHRHDVPADDLEVLLGENPSSTAEILIARQRPARVVKPSCSLDALNRPLT